MIFQFFLVLARYLKEIVPALAVGFFLSGLIHEFIPSRLVERYLGRGGISPIACATIVGAALPICCWGSLPVAVSFYKKGARLGPILAFLVATPATSVSALVVTYWLLGLKFTVYLFFAVILMGLVMGGVGNLLKFEPKGQGLYLNVEETGRLLKDPVCGMEVREGSSLKVEYGGSLYHFCSPHCKETFEKSPKSYVGKAKKSFKERLRGIFRFAFVDMVKEIGPEILLGLILAALVASVVPIGSLIKRYLAGGWGYPFSLVFGLLMYICSTATVPLVDAFINKGMNIGAGMVLLLVGPITSYGTILVLRKEFGARTLLVYLGVISTLSLALGYFFSFIG